MKEKRTIAIYNENCIQSGQVAYEPRGYSRENWPHDDNDVTVYEGTREELVADAREMLRIADEKSAAAGQHQRQSARSILRVLGEEVEE